MICFTPHDPANYRTTEVPRVSIDRWAQWEHIKQGMLNLGLKPIAYNRKSHIFVVVRRDGIIDTIAEEFVEDAGR